MATLLSRIPFDTSVLNARLSKLNDYWRPSEPTSEPTSDVTTTISTTTTQSESSLASLPESANHVSPGNEPQGPADTEEFDFQPSSSSSQQAADIEADKATGDKAGIAELIAQYGSSSATSWLEFARYKIWRPSVPIPQSSFPPIQGYLRSDPFVFAWGNPIVSDPAALEATCAAFIEWAKSQKLRPIWLCVDGRMEEVLGAQGSKFGWSTLSCIVEDFLDPRSVVELAHSHGGGSEVKDFKKNLRRAERENVQVREVQPDQWTDAMKKQVEEGIAGWKKSKTGIQIASVSRSRCFRLFRASDAYFSLFRHLSSRGSTLSIVGTGSPRRTPTLSPSLFLPAFTTSSIRSRTLCLSRMRLAALRRRSSTVPCRTSRTRAFQLMSRIASRKMGLMCGQSGTSRWPTSLGRSRATLDRKASSLTTPTLRTLASRRPPVSGTAVSPSLLASLLRTRSRPSTT